MHAILESSAPKTTSTQRITVPFSLQDIKSAIPPGCFQPIVWRSLLHFVVDWSVVAGLFALAFVLDSWFFWPVFWLAQGTMFWAVFVVGHDCGHGSFSRSRFLNSVIGHICHTPLLVPYHSWRISHRLHHTVTGDADREEVWYPYTESEYRTAPFYVRVMRFSPVLLLLYPFYLLRRSPRHDGSHFWPGANNDLFRPNEKGQVILSSLMCLAFIAGLGLFTYHFGFAALAKYYLGPYLVFVAWIDLVTYLHHTDVDVPWYRGNEWTFVKGMLSTIDRDYGLVNEIHHNIGTHIVHHLFINIPHYHLRRANEAIKPVLGEFYRESRTPILKAFWHALRGCRFVDDTGDTLYYRSGPTR